MKKIKRSKKVLLALLFMVAIAICVQFAYMSTPIPVTVKSIEWMEYDSRRKEIIGSVAFDRKALGYDWNFSYDGEMLHEGKTLKIKLVARRSSTALEIEPTFGMRFTDVEPGDYRLIDGTTGRQLAAFNTAKIDQTFPQAHKK